MRYCAWPLCAVKVKSGYCEEHEALRKKLPRARKDNRSPKERGYDSAWHRVKNEYLLAHPDCEYCAEPAQEVHHLIPLSRGGNRLSTSNLIALCRICHRRKHNALSA